MYFFAMGPARMLPAIALIGLLQVGFLGRADADEPQRPSRRHFIFRYAGTIDDVPEGKTAKISDFFSLFKQ